MSIEKRLLNEMNKITPNMSDELKNHPINKREKKPHFKMGISIGLVLATLIVITTILSINFLAPTNLNAYYIVEINPTIMIEVNKGIVSEVKSGNNDGDALLLDLNIEGKSLDKAMDDIALNALRQGYIEESGDAIRVSSIGGSSEGSDFIKNSLVSYFKESGYYVAVISNDVNLCSDIKLDDFSKYFKSLDSKSYMNEEPLNIEEYYKENYLFSYLFDSIRINLNELKQIKNLLIRIDEVYEELLVDDNIDSMIKDYFYLVTYYKNKECPISVKVKMDEMKALLEEYKRLSGISIDNLLDMKTELIKLSLIDIDWLMDITNSLDSFIKELNVMAENTIKSIIDTISIVIPTFSDIFDALSNIPKTLDEFYRSVDLLTIAKRDERINANMESFNKVRNSISDNEYNLFIDGIINEFESLENYFNKNAK